MDNKNRLEINTLTKGTAEPVVVVVNGKEYLILPFETPVYQDVMDKLSKLILDLRDTFGATNFRLFSPQYSIGDQLVMNATFAKKQNTDILFSIVAKGLNVPTDWFSREKITHVEIEQLLEKVLEANGINLFNKNLDKEKKSPLTQKNSPGV